MKRMRRKLLSLALCLFLLAGMLPLGAAASTAYPDMPRNWSTAALTAAVENGLFKGDETGYLRPEKAITRAEMAAVVVRAFGAGTKTDIGRFGDVSPSAWFYEDMQAAAGMGAFLGDGGRLRPNNPITREEAFLVLSRVMNLPAGDSGVLSQYRDWEEISRWAVEGVTAMSSAGYIHGDNGYLRPRASISRAEFAQVMHNCVKTYFTKAGTYTQAAPGNVMVNVPGVTLKDLTIGGDLILGDGVGDGEITLDHVTVNGRLLVRGGGAHSILIQNGSQIGQIVVAKVDGNVRVALSEGCGAELVTIEDGKDGIILEGDVGKILLNCGAPLTFRGGTAREIQANAPSSKVLVAEAGTVEQVTVSKEGGGFTLEAAEGGLVRQVVSEGKNTAILGKGRVDAVEIKAEGASVQTGGTQVAVDRDVPGGAQVGEDMVEPGETVTSDPVGSGVKPPEPPPGPAKPEKSPPTVEFDGIRWCVYANGTAITVEAKKDPVEYPNDYALLINYKDENNQDKIIEVPGAGPNGIGASIYGGRKDGDTPGASVTVKSGNVDCVYGGGHGRRIAAAVRGDATVTVSGGTVTNVYGGGRSSANNTATVTGNTSVTVTGGTVTNVFGGGLGEESTASTVTGNTSVSVTGGTVTNVFGGGQGEGAASTVTGDATVTIAGGTVTGNVFGGGRSSGSEASSTVGSASVAVSGGTMTNVYGGGYVDNAGSSTVGTASVQVNGGTMNKIYVGGTSDMSSIQGSATLDIKKDGAVTLQGDEHGIFLGQGLSNAASITLNAPGRTVSMDANLILGREKSLTVGSETTFSIPAEKTLTNQGTITNSGTIDNSGAITNSGAIDNKGTIGGNMIDPPGTLTGSADAENWPNEQTGIPGPIAP